MSPGLFLALGLLCQARAAEVQAGGHVEANLRAGLAGEQPTWLDFRDAAVFGGFVQATYDTRVVARGAADLRLHLGSSATLLDDTTDPETVSTTSLRMKDAWVELREVGVRWLDLRLGVQRVPWGVADGVHVADPVNPYDLEDPLDLEGRLSVPAALARLHWGQVELQLVGVPVAWPAALPTAGLELVPTDDELLGDATFEGVEVGQIQTRVSPPDSSLINAQGGGRLAWAAPVGDLALSGWFGRDSLPQADGVMVLTGFQTDSDRVDVAVPLVYPWLAQVGLEARGELFAEVGGWVELAGVLPQEAVLTLSQTQLSDLERLGTIDEVPDPLPTVVLQDGKPYLKAIVGLDRSFDRVLVSAQYLYGFPTERRRDELGHYAVLFSRIALSDTVVTQLRGMTDGQGALVAGELQLLHGDAGELWVGGAWAGGSGTLAAFSGLTHAGGGVRARF